MPLTAEIHEALAKYNISGAQHGTSGNNSERLRNIAQKTNTTKANVATALQMISWGVKVNDFGNAMLDENGDFIKMPNAGMTDAMWNEMVSYAQERNIKGGNYKKLNLPFENKLLALPRDIREQMVQGVEDFVYGLLTKVFNTQDTAPLALEAILAAGSYDMGPKSQRLEDPTEWTEDKIKQRMAALDSDKGPTGDFDD